MRNFFIGVFYFSISVGVDMFLRRIELQMVSDRSVSYGPIPKGVPKDVTVRTKEDVYRVFSFLSGRVQEEMYALYLDTKNRVLGYYMVSRGSLDKTVCDPVSVLRPAILCGCASIILVHNHPSGNAEPSMEDIVLTRNMKQVCDLMGFSLLDHVVIGDGHCRSIIEML